MKTLVTITFAGTLLGATAGWIFATLTENTPGYRSTAAFMDGMYVPIHTVLGLIAGATLGFIASVAFTLMRRR